MANRAGVFGGGVIGSGFGARVVARFCLRRVAHGTCAAISGRANGIGCL
jgi:hypothetical protein